ncbi:MAG: hypothetical protein JO297_21145 [Nitrososphaeraceae archaeon]|nr:hypothetical protein [Nitrososphaeraceae archaeon]
MPSFKIISPTSGENISTGSSVTISGIVTGTNNTYYGTGIFGDGIHCLVSVIVNNLKPYQNATAYGPNGDHDYSKWRYVLHTLDEIKRGQNKITAKLECEQSRMIGTNSLPTTNSTLKIIKWYSVNVTGTSASKASFKDNQAISNSTAFGLQDIQHGYNTEHNKASLSNATNAASRNNAGKFRSPAIVNKTNSENANSDISGPFSGHIQKPSTLKSNYNINNKNKNNPKSISISVESSQNVINGKGTSIVKAIANDATTGTKLENATIKLRITFASNGTSKLITSHNGVARYSANLNPMPNHHNNLGFTASARASAPGYISTSKTTTSSLSSSISGGTSGTQGSILNSSSTENLTQSILKDVRNKLKLAGIYASLG